MLGRVGAATGAARSVHGAAMNLTLIAAVIAAALGFASAWQLQGHQIIKLKLETANERISQQRAARASLEHVTSQLAQAQANAATRATQLRVATAGVVDAGHGLRQSSDAALRASADSLNACTATANAYHTVFGECSEQLQAMGVNATGHASDTQTLTEAWAK